MSSSSGSNGLATSMSVWISSSSRSKRATSSDVRGTIARAPSAPRAISPGVVEGVAKDVGVLGGPEVPTDVGSAPQAPSQSTAMTAVAELVRETAIAWPPSRLRTQKPRYDLPYQHENNRQEQGRKQP